MFPGCWCEQGFWSLWPWSLRVLGEGELMSSARKTRLCNWLTCVCCNTQRYAVMIRYQNLVLLPKREYWFVPFEKGMCLCLPLDWGEGNAVGQTVPTEQGATFPSKASSNCTVRPSAHL